MASAEIIDSGAWPSGETGTYAATASILLVEDTPSEATALTHALENEGFAVQAVMDGVAAVEVAAAGCFDLVLLDLRLPKLSGFEVCRRIRSTSDVRIIVLSASDAEADRVRSLELGADDFLTKPLSVTELSARIRAALRRRDLDRDGRAVVRTIGAVTIDLTRHEITLDGVLIRTTPSEFKLLALLSDEPGRVYTRTEIVRELWESNFVGDRRSCDVHVTNLRRKLEPDPGSPMRIVTVRGVGYKLNAI